MTSPDHPPESSVPGLKEWIRRRIKARGDVPFAQFMEWALYHPEYGYYTRGPNIGPKGDFTTSPEASPAFGELLAAHVAEIDALLGSPAPFDLIECGPGRGTLAIDLLDTLSKQHPSLLSQLRYWLVEVSPALAALQQERLASSGLLSATNIRWASSLTALPLGLNGAFLANEVVDAFPVHVLENREGTILEQYVTLAEGSDLRLAYHAPSDRRLLAFLTRYKIELQPGQRIELNLAADEWVAQAGAVMGRGIATIIDYGDEQPGRYSEARKEGTLLGYFGGAVTDDLLARPGRQDLTALVDFTALEDAALQRGFTTLFKTRQANFLLGLGLGTTVTAAARETSLEDALRRRQGLQALINPEGLGRFHVLVLGKGITGYEASALSGGKYVRI